TPVPLPCSPLSRIDLPPREPGGLGVWALSVLSASTLGLLGVSNPGSGCPAYSAFDPLGSRLCPFSEDPDAGLLSKRPLNVQKLGRSNARTAGLPDDQPPRRLRD